MTDLPATLPQWLRDEVTANGVDIQNAYKGLGLRYPFGHPYEGFDGEGFPFRNQGNYNSLVASPKTKAEWDAIPYNPPPWIGGHLEPDPNADPRPSWEDMLRGLRLKTMLDKVHSKHLKPIILDHTAALANAPIQHPTDDGDVDIGDGIDHLTALVHHASAARAAGVDWPVAIMRGSDRKFREFWTEGEVGEVLNAAAAARIRAVSASTIVREKGREIWLTALDPNGGLTETATEDEKISAREAAAETYNDMRDNIGRYFATALAEVDNKGDSLPDDLDRAKGRLIARLATFANRARNRVVDEAGEAQSAFFEAACDEQKRALETISGARQAGNNKIRDAATKEAAETEYQKAVAFIFAIPVDNSPIWIDGDDDPYIPVRGVVDYPLPQPETGRPTVTLKVRNPHADELKGGRKNLSMLGNPTVFLERSQRGWSTFFGVADDEGERTVTLTWGSQRPLRVGDTLEIIARNNCGPTAIKLKFVAPPPATPGS